MKYAIRHGEVLLQPVDKLPKAKVEQHTSYIVGHSETGHHHVLESDKKFDVMLDKAFLYISLSNPATLVHKKTTDAHKTLKVPKGKYRIIHKKEYNPWTKVVQRVFD